MYLHLVPQNEGPRELRYCIAVILVVMLLGMLVGTALLVVEVVAGNVVEVVGLLVVEVVAAAVDDKHWLVLQMVPSAGMHLRLLHWDEVCNVVVIHKGGLMGIHKGSQKRY